MGQRKPAGAPQNPGTGAKLALFVLRMPEATLIQTNMSPSPASEPPNKRPDRKMEAFATYSIFKKRPRRPASSQCRPLLMAQRASEQSGLPPKMHPCENGRYGSRDQVIDDADATVTSKGANARSITIPALDATTLAATATVVMKS